MNIEGAIFDFDGTLVDSMELWRTLGTRYLINKGCEPEANLWDITKTMTLFEAAKYFNNVYGLNETEGDIIRGLNELIEEDYRYDIQLKPGARDFIENLSSKGVPMIIASATEQYMVAAAVERLGLEDYFLSILSCKDIGIGKEEPDIFLEALNILETPMATTIVFEDSLHAIVSAKEAGFPVAAVFDPHAAEDEEEIRGYADWYFEGLDEVTLD